MDKNALRGQIKLKRKALHLNFCQKASDSLLKQFQQNPLLKPFQHIAVYLSHNKEIDLRPLIEALWIQGKTLYAPVLHPLYKNVLCFIPYTPSTQTQPNKFGILEPKHPASEPIEASKLDAVLMPLLAFDRHGHRLGTGGGYYDRTFAFKNGKKPLLIGCAYQFQFCDMLPVESHDISMDLVVTEEQIYHPSS